MTEEEQKIIKRIINEEKDLKQLEQIRKWILERAQVIQKTQDISSLHNMDILIQPFQEFIDQNLNSKQKRGFKIASIIIAITTHHKLSDWRKVQVYHAVGIGENILRKQKGVGESSIKTLESLLNKYELSLNVPLTEEQEYDYQSVQKTKNIK